MKVLSMLNTKYFIVPTKDGVQAQQNPDAFGNAWFVNDIKWVSSANEAILSLADTDLKSTAVINEEFRDQVNSDFGDSSSAEIKLLSQQPNELVYRTSARK